MNNDSAPEYAHSGSRRPGDRWGEFEPFARRLACRSASLIAMGCASVWCPIRHRDVTEGKVFLSRNGILIRRGGSGCAGS